MKSEKTKGTEELHGFAEEIRSINSSEHIEIWEVLKTPLGISRTNDGYHVILGTARLTEGLETLEDAVIDSRRMDWARLYQVMYVTAQQVQKEREAEILKAK